MAGVIRSISSLPENAFAESLAFGVGFALGAALDPVATGIRQETWKLDPLRAPDPGTLAGGVAQGQVNEGKAREWAKEHGFGDEQMSALIDIANTGPPLGLAYQAWRRGELGDGEFETALRRAAIEPRWYGALKQLRHELLDPGALATAIHRGIIAGQGLLIAEPPGGGGKVPHVPPSPIDAIHEAEGLGITRERLRVLVGNTGLPLALGEMLTLLNRGEVTDDDVRRSIAQSNVRNEYMDVALGLRRRLLTPHEWQELALRGWKSRDEARHGSAMSGMTREDADSLFDMLGRPLATHQVTTGLARGGKYGGVYEGVPEPFAHALRQSNVRPEWGNLAYANRYSYPSAFVLRALAQAGELSQADTHRTLLEIGWPPHLVEKVVKHWAPAETAKADPWVSKAETQLWTATHKAYVQGQATEAVAQENMAAIGVTADAQARVLELWKLEAALTTEHLTKSQIRKAYRDAKLTLDEAVTRLERLGMDAADAELYLTE